MVVNIGIELLSADVGLAARLGEMMYLYCETPAVWDGADVMLVRKSTGVEDLD